MQQGKFPQFIRKDHQGISVWQFYYCSENKTHRARQKYPNKTQANEAYRIWVEKIVSGKLRSNKRLFDIIDSYALFTKDVKTIEHQLNERPNLNQIKEFFKDIKISDIRRPEVIEFRTWRQAQGVSNATVNRTLSTFSSVFQFALDRDYCHTNPVRSGIMLRELKRKEPKLTKEQALRLIDSANPYQLIWLKLALFTGMRRGEICSLKWSDIDWTSGYIVLLPENTKSKKSRSIKMAKELEMFLKEVKSDNNSSTFVLEHFGEGVKSIKKSWEGMRAKHPWLKEMGFRFHDFRHVHATILRNSGTSLSVIQGILGHSDARTTERYAHLDPMSSTEDVDKISVFLKP